jgi:hypothetical protein
MPPEWGDKWTSDSSALICGMEYGFIFITNVLIVFSALSWRFSVGRSIHRLSTVDVLQRKNIVHVLVTML